MGLIKTFQFKQISYKQKLLEVLEREYHEGALG